MEPISVILIGAGNRGHGYVKRMAKLPEKYRVVAVADPAEGHVKEIQKMFDLPDSACYKGWEEILAQPKLADVALIATVDNMHYEPALAAIDKGYDLLLEKPVAQTAQQCVDIANAAKRKGVKVLVCHVLRYTPFYDKVKRLLMEGAVGDVISMDLVEAIENVHFSHSYVRGNWHKESESTPMLLAKSCHDLDIAQWLLDKPCKRVHSFGSLTHFTKANAPEGAPVRCADGSCPIGETCPYNCIKHYYDRKTNYRRSIITTGISKDFTPTDEEVMQALKTRDYGLCVYHANNDVVDHQTVNMEFDGGVTVTLNVNAFNRGGRYIRVYGTKGELFAYAADKEIRIYDFVDKTQRSVPVQDTKEDITGGHGGGDDGIVWELYEYMSGTYTGYRAADIDVSVRNHMIGFAAEKARHTGTVVSLEQFLEEYGYMND